MTYALTLNLATDAPHDKLVPIEALVYLGAEILLMAYYSVTSCGIVCGLLKYLCHKITDKVMKKPIVEFHRSDRPNHFVEMQDYSEDVRTMKNPLSDERTSSEGRPAGAGLSTDDTKEEASPLLQQQQNGS